MKKLFYISVGKRPKSRENASFAWDFFDIRDSEGEWAICLICERKNIQKKYKHGGSTSNLLLHLWKEHRVDKSNYNNRVCKELI
jgi:hypothetical protein